jgi:hypothetical protein
MRSVDSPQIGKNIKLNSLIIQNLNSSMKIVKRKARGIADRLIKKKVIDGNIYAGSEEVLLNKVVEIIVKINNKEVGL